MQVLDQKGSPIHAASSLNCEPSPPESISWVRGVGACGAMVGTPKPDDRRRPREGVLDWSSPLLEGDGSWVERTVTLTLVGYEILEERAKFTVYKILVTSGQGDSWVIFRRYTDRLKDKAVCETLEENNHRLQRELLGNQRVVDALKKTLEERENHISFLVKKVKPLSLSSERFVDSCQQTHSSSHRRGHTVINGLEQQHMDEETGDDRECSVPEPDKDSNKGTRETTL